MLPCQLELLFSAVDVCIFSKTDLNIDAFSLTIASTLTRDRCISVICCCNMAVDGETVASSAASGEVACCITIQPADESSRRRPPANCESYGIRQTHHHTRICDSRINSYRLKTRLKGLLWGQSNAIPRRAVIACISSQLRR